jgi:hypothetical protein
LEDIKVYVWAAWLSQRQAIRAPQNNARSAPRPMIELAHANVPPFRRGLTEVVFEPCSNPLIPLPSIASHFMYITGIDDEFVGLLQA